MPITQGQSKRKPSGGRNTSTNPKRVHQTAHIPASTTIGDEKQSQRRARGGNTKHFLRQVQTVNLYDPQKEKHVEAELEDVLESAADRNYVRRNIITKGTVVQTNKGKARITNRPGQEAAVNAVLIQED